MASAPLPSRRAASVPGRGRVFDSIAQTIGPEHAFGHPLGHGVGLEIHERPLLAARDRTELAPGMVITNEPGVYVPGWGGARIEDMVLITESGHEVLTAASREVPVAP